MVFRTFFICNCLIAFTLTLNGSVIDLTKQLFKNPKNEALEETWEEQCSIPFKQAQKMVQKIIEEKEQEASLSAALFELTSKNRIFLAACIEEIQRKKDLSEASKQICCNLKDILKRTCLCEKRKGVSVLNFKTKHFFHDPYMQSPPKSTVSVIKVTKALLNNPENDELKEEFEKAYIAPFEHCQRIIKATLDGDSEELTECFTRHPFYSGFQMFLATFIDVMHTRHAHNEEEKEKQKETLQILEEIFTFWSEDKNCDIDLSLFFRKLKEKSPAKQGK